MAYIDFPDGLKGQKERKAFWLSEDGLKLISQWRRQGMPLTKIAEDCLGVSKTAFWGWYRQSEDLRKACAVSMDITNASVEESLLKRALGYDYYEESYELMEGEMICVRKQRKHVPADMKAIMTWIYNRMPNRWRAIQEPLENTQYKDTVKEILVAMKEVAENGKEQILKVEDTSGQAD